MVTMDEEHLSVELARYLDLHEAERTRRQDAEHVLRLIAAHPDYVEPDDAVQAHAELVGMARTYLADRDS